MEEKKSIKVSLSTVVCFIIIMLLLITIVGMRHYYNNLLENKEKDNSQSHSTKEVSANSDNSQKNTQEKSNSNQINSIEKIELTDSDKIRINEKLINNVYLPLRLITNFEIEKKVEYDINLLNNMKNRFYIVWYTMKNDKSINSKWVDELCEDGTYHMGAVAIEKRILEDYYYKIFNEKISASELAKAINEREFSVKGEMFYGSFPSGWGINPFLLKAKSLEYDNNSDTYTLYLDFLTTTDAEQLVEYNKSNILKWNDTFNYAILKINYNKSNNDEYSLNSLVFVKK